MGAGCAQRKIFRFRPLWQSLTLRSEVTGNTMEVVMPENTTPATVESDEDLVTETLIEEVSIDGMCGVY
jgi:mycofactocin precursor